MVAKKKRSLVRCIKCYAHLSPTNWNTYDKIVRHYICKRCRAKQDHERRSSNQEYGAGQRNRYRSRRSAVIFYYGNRCAKCLEDDYDKLAIYGVNGGKADINYLYNNLVDMDEYQVLCYNCSHQSSKDKYALQNKTEAITHYGGCCIDCQEDNIEKLTLNQSTSAKVYRQIIADRFPIQNTLVLCFNCHHSRMAKSKRPVEG